MEDFDDILSGDKKVQIEPKKKNYVLIALDKSGSMIAIQEQAIEFFNSQITEAQNAKKMENRLCLIMFSDKAEVVMWDVGADEVELLDHDTYKPDGWTAMLDAVGVGINKLLQQPDINDPNVSVLFTIISDGHENNSSEYNYESIPKMIKEVNETNRWTFVYLGANQDLSKIRNMGISEGNMRSFAADANGMLSATYSHNIGSRSYYTSRLAGHTNTSSFYSGKGFYSGDNINSPGSDWLGTVVNKDDDTKSTSRKNKKKKNG